MAKKDFDIYYNKIYSQYHEMFDAIKEFEQDCENNIITQEQLDTYKQTVEGIKNSYMTLSYVKYLLNMPVRKQKQSRYKTQNSKLLMEAKLGDEVIQENNSRLDTIRNLAK